MGSFLHPAFYSAGALAIISRVDCGDVIQNLVLCPGEKKSQQLNQPGVLQLLLPCPQKRREYSPAGHSSQGGRPASLASCPAGEDMNLGSAGEGLRRGKPGGIRWGSHRPAGPFSCDFPDESPLINNMGVFPAQITTMRSEGS